MPISYSQVNNDEYWFDEDNLNHILVSFDTELEKTILEYYLQKCKKAIERLNDET